MSADRTYKPWQAIVAGGGLAATFDIVYAFIRNGQHGRSPLWVLQSVASGWLGESAFEGGMPAGILGLFSHYSILFVAAGLYYVSSRRLVFLASRPIPSGLVFGVLVYLVMNFVVLKLSAFPFHLSYPMPRLLEGFASHAVFVGLPIATFVAMARRQRGNAATGA
jgi:hypothetical protein